MKDPLYVDPLTTRYASAAMQRIFSQESRALIWRDLWIALARAQHEMGLAVGADQVLALEKARDRIDLARVAEVEKRLRHDVMAHIHVLGEQAPAARPIIHLGATSCFITDNADLLLMRRALGLVSDRLLRVIHALAGFARREADRPTLGLTHLQPAQLTTVGKRAALWIQDAVDAWRGIDEMSRTLPFRGVKGTTGTQASFLHLFQGDATKVRELEGRVAHAMGFEKLFPLTGQTYPRSWDFRIVSRLAEIAITLHKYSNDLRLLQSWHEIEEPFEEDQVGSSAMPYKRNPMRAERMGSLANVLLTLVPGFSQMAAQQWLERTLDDSAFRRTLLPQAFLTADALLLIARNVSEGLKVRADVARRRVEGYLPFLAAEEILMAGVEEGGDRQDLHERIRKLTWMASEALLRGEENPLHDLLSADPEIAPILGSLPPWDPQRFVGLAPEQTREYLDHCVDCLPRPAEDDLRELDV